jgi:hypothetical protein
MARDPETMSLAEIHAEFDKLSDRAHGMDGRPFSKRDYDRLDLLSGVLNAHYGWDKDQAEAG